MSTPPVRPNDYWTDSRRPLASLLFLLPLLGVYELGTLLLGNGSMSAARNGADTWMRSWLHLVGFDRPWTLPALILTILIGWHLVGRFPWRTSLETIVGMGAECLLGAILLLVLGQMLSLSCRHFGWLPTGPVAASVPTGATTAVSFIGAGIYEEVLFRLLLLPGVYLLLRSLLFSRRSSAVLSIMATSTIFALAHYLEPGSPESVLHPQSFWRAAQAVIQTPQAWFGFGFRMLAGLVFAAMFVLRGFGITVGCHVLYDLLVGLVMATHDS